MSATTFVLDTRDGYPVVVHRWEPEGEVRGVVSIVHGMAEHAARYAHVADALNRAGYAVYAEDHRGHGESIQDEGDLGLLAEERGWATVIDDLHRVIQRARADHPGVPLYLVGQSFGTFLVQQLLFTFPDEIDGAVLSSTRRPIGALGEVAAALARAERRRLGRRGRSKLLMRLTFGAFNNAFKPVRTEYDWLSRDEEQVDRYVEDPRCGFDMTTQFFVDMFDGLRIIQQPKRIAQVPSDLPIYLFVGSLDPMGGPTGVAKMAEAYEQAGLTDVERRVYDGGRHEMLNEINRDEVIADLVAWLDRHTARAATGSG